MKMCETCETIKFYQEHKNKDFKEKIFAKISVYTWDKNQRAIKGNHVGAITTKAYNLNYCPTCGKKIEKLESKDD